MYIVTDDLEIINFYQYQNLTVEREDPGKGQLVLTAFEDIRDALAAGETYYSLETVQ